MVNRGMKGRKVFVGYMDRQMPLPKWRKCSSGELLIVHTIQKEMNLEKYDPIAYKKIRIVIEEIKGEGE